MRTSSKYQISNIKYQLNTIQERQGRHPRGADRLHAELPQPEPRRRKHEGRERGHHQPGGERQIPEHQRRHVRPHCAADRLQHGPLGHRREPDVAAHHLCHDRRPAVEERQLGGGRRWMRQDHRRHRVPPHAPQRVLHSLLRGHAQKRFRARDSQASGRAHRRHQPWTMPSR